MSSTLGLMWGIVAVTAALLMLSAGIVVSMTIHTRKMKESERKFRLLFERAFDALALTDEDGKVIDANQALGELLGYAKDELLGQPIANYLHGDETGIFHLAMKRALSQGSYMMGEIVLKDKAGGKRHAEGAVGHFEFLESHYLIISFRDLAERIEAAEALRAERQGLYEKNVALREVLQHIEEEKAEIRRNVADKIEQVILPLMKRIAVTKGAIDGNFYTLLLEELRGLSGFSGAPSLYYKLSPREIEICDLIRTGASTKDIAQALNISMSTVSKHRERIRNRLDIAHKDVNLTAFLQKLK